MTVVEKNDVDISKLFVWNKEVVIERKGKKFKFFIRLVGDADANRSRVMALRFSADLRKKLKTLESDERIAYIPDFTDEDVDKLIEAIILFGMREFTQLAYKEVRVPLPKDPGSDAPTEKIEKYQADIDAYPAKRAAEIKKFIDEKVRRRREELSELGKDQLLALYESSIINEICEQELLKRYREHCVFFGTFKDRSFSERYFTKFEDFDNLPSDIKDTLVKEYASLEIESEMLKK